MDMKGWYIQTLYVLAKLGALGKALEIDTKTLSRYINTSQQTASRRIVELYKGGYIQRTFSKRRQALILTSKGVELLREVYMNLHMIFNNITSIQFEGMVFTGLGEGAFYVSLPFYKQQFIDKLGFEPYPGTLNLRLKSVDDVAKRRNLELLPSINIEGYSNSSRTYGSVKCYHALVNNSIKAAVIICSRTHYGPDVLEVISPLNLRKELSLNDGDVVKVSVNLRDTMIPNISH
jgi:riboflavin kinase